MAGVPIAGEPGRNPELLTPRPRQLFSYPFRIFFLSASIMAAAAIPVWLLMLFGVWQPPASIQPHYWHRHEMLFGFLEAAIAGFLLTAVCNWTGTVRLHGTRLFALWGIWVMGRVLMLLGAGLPAWLVSVVDLSFLPLVMLDAGLRIWRARQSPRMVLLVVLAALWLMDIGFHWRPEGPFAHGALLMAMALMLVIGGRITPTFSANWLQMNGRSPRAVRTNGALERLTLVLLFVLLALTLAPAGPPGLTGVVALAASAASAVQIVLWRGWLVRAEPLLWILHLALAWIPISLLLRGGAQFGWLAPSAWVHAAAAGAMAALILGVMGRVALAHTGRSLRLPPGVSAAFVAILCAGALRVLTGINALPWQSGIMASAALWVAAYAIYLARFWRVLATPRIDGGEG